MASSSSSSSTSSSSSSSSSSSRPSVTVFSWALTEVGVPDIAWLGDSESVIVSASDSGVIRLWQTTDSSKTALPAKQRKQQQQQQQQQQQKQQRQQQHQQKQKQQPNGKQLQVISEHREHRSITSSLDVNQNQKELLLSGSWDRTIKLWIPQETSSLATFEEHTDSVTRVEWNPKFPSYFASSSYDCTVKFWDKRKAKSVATINNDEIPVVSLTWDPHQPFTLASGDLAGEIRVYDARNLRQHLLSNKEHQAAVRKLVYTWPGFLASCGDDQAIHITNLTTNTILHKFDDHNHFVRGLSWIRSAETLVSGSWDKTVKFHSLPKPI